MNDLYPSAAYCPICDNGVIDHGRGVVDVFYAWEGEDDFLAALAGLGIEAFGEIPCSPECYYRWDC
jgi:hypothetical protein